MSELRTAISISARHRDLIERFKERDILGFKLASTTDIFLLAVSLGLDDPKPLKSKDPFLRTEYVTKTRDKAILECVALGNISDDSEIDSFANLEASLDLCERCAEAGFQKLEEMAEKAEWDKGLFEKRFAARLNILYSQYVEAI